MRIIKFIILLALSLNLSAAESDYSICEDQAIEFFQDAIAKDQSNILGKQYQLTMLKLARASIADARPSLEDEIKKLSKSFDPNDPKLKYIDQMYKDYGYEKDLESVIDSMRSANYWKRSTRFYNEDVSAFILLAKDIEPELGLNERDAAITWFMSYVSDKASDQFGETSASANLTNISSRLANFTGAYAGKRSLTDSEIKKKIDELKKDIDRTMLDLHRELVIELGSECFEGGLFGGACAYTNDLSQVLFSQAVMDLTGELKKSKINSLEDSIYSEKGKFQFSLLKLPSASEYRKEIPLSLIPPKLDYKSVADIRIHDSYWINREDIEKLEDRLNILSDKEKIKAFHEHADSENYLIMNKETMTLEYFDKSGRLIKKVRLNLEGKLGDEGQLGGAGNYFVHSYKNGVLYLQDDRGNIRPYEGVDLPGLKVSTNFYILSESKDHHFKIKGGKIHFTTKGKKSDYLPFNFSKRDTSVTSIKSVIKKKDYQTKTAIEFMGEIDKRKGEITKLYGLTDHEYNELSKLAFGILGNESQFGKSKKYHIKEALPWLVAIAKGNGTNTSSNSRGPTQIKTVPKKIAKKYGTTKDNLEQPKMAAVATMGFLAEALAELKAKEKFHPGINEENRFNYIHYIYMGKSSEITKATATPMRNIYFKQILNFNKGLEVYEKVD
ncbi:hypothetical protein [Halobacteriovorax sp. JY17]|uniref:hypothetical protein n=1 Tax=Halobacteriovorax sp. JY17 TaxID=2014617 RepID=UPI000C447B7D|nr:hypothetical protein [Halobacteriovorax sp. JY17]PIK15706.1 MAG: hypothetical protein CES88_02970 [Halobacteriovorax sp. JY17]